MRDRLQQVRALVSSGCSVLGTGRHTKRPSAPMPSWKHLQERPPTDAEIAEIAKQPGIAVICGKVSGNLEIVDLEGDAPLGDIEAAVEARKPGLLAKLYQAETPSGGLHLAYRCSVIAGNQKLASSSTGKTWGETRGEGGYFLTTLSFPDAHPSGKPYKHKAGSLKEIPQITPEEREMLHETIRSFNEHIREEKARGYREATQGNGTKPGEDFNNRADVLDQIQSLLKQYGWSKFANGRRGELWSRPDVTDHGSATLFPSGYLHPFSSNALPFCAGETYSPFAIFTELKHSGDFSAAAKDLFALGYGQSNGSKPTARPHSTATSVPQSAPVPRFIPKTLRDLREEPEEKISYVMDQTLPRGGTSLVVAKSKIGKTTLVSNIAARGSKGDEYLGRSMPKGKWVYLAMEEKRSQMIARFHNLDPDPDNLIIHIGPAPGTTPEAAFFALEDLIQEYKPDGVVVDTMARLLRVKDYSDYGQMCVALEPITDLARRSDCHIMLLHHARKGDMSEDSSLGSMATLGNVDTMIMLSKQRESGRRIVASMQRYGTDIPETLLTFEEGRIEAGGDLKTALLNERKKAVLDAVGQDPIPETTIKELVGGTNSGLTSKAVRALFDEGALLRSGGGKKGDPFLYYVTNKSASNAQPAPLERDPQERYEPVFDDPERRAAWESWEGQPA